MVNAIVIIRMKVGRISADKKIWKLTRNKVRRKLAKVSTHKNMFGNLILKCNNAFDLNNLSIIRRPEFELPRTS